MVLIEFETAFLLLLIQQDESAFNTFYLKTVDIFFRYLKTNYFLDIIADFYVKFRNAVRSYDIEQSFSAYTWTIFKNALKDYFKKTKEIRFSQLDSPNPDFESFEDSLVDEFDYSELLDQNFQLDMIQSAMQELDPTSREIIFLKFIEDKSNAEIEEILQISQEVIRQRISRAFKKLRTLLNSES